MTKDNLTIGKSYCVTTTEDCTITSANGVLLCTVTAGTQATFIAIETSIDCSSDSAIIVPSPFKHALTSAASSEGGSTGGILGYELVECNSSFVDISLDPATVIEYDLSACPDSFCVNSISIIGASESSVAYAAFWLAGLNSTQGITWPTDAIWIDGTSEGSAPTLEPNTKYRFAVSQEPDGQIIISLDYYYAIQTT